MIPLNFKNKKVLVMGLGLHGGGGAVARWLNRQGAKIIVADLKSKKELAAPINQLRRLKGIRYHLGGHRVSDFSASDIVIKGPGVPPDSPYLKIARKNNIPIITDIHIFLFNLPPGVKIIGITGTKGKSTAATLIAKILAQKYHVHLAGNIRKSVLEILPKVKKGDFVVLELSSFQLEDILGLHYRFPVAVLTSLFPDHLNRHGTFENYRKAKEVIFSFQGRGDLLVVNEADLVTKNLRSRNGRTVKVGGENFAANAARAVGGYFKVPAAKTEKAIKNFKGLPGRLEKIRELNGVMFINDTTATNPGAAIHGIKIIREKYPNKNLVVIAGGYDKSLAVGEFVGVLQKYANNVVLLPGSATDKIIKKSKGHKEWIKVKNMPEAVRASYQIFRHRFPPHKASAGQGKSGDGGVVLLSPGAASFGLFQHEFDRGDKFNAAVRKLK